MRERRVAILFGLSLLTVLVMVLALCGGSVHIPAPEVARMLWRMLTRRSFADEWPDSWRVILFQLRLPRVLLAAVTGASLAAAGATYQGILRNPMADPFILGVSAGAALGATIVMVGGLGGALVPLAAFLGALSATAVVYMLGRTGGRASVMTLLLAGVAMSAMLSGMVSLLIFFSGEEMRAIVYWTMGGLGRADWQGINTVLPFMILGMIPLVLHSGQLNAMLMGDETAQHLGVDVGRVRRYLLLSASLLAAVAVSIGGIIGFVGLIVPHIVRLVAGPDHRFLMPASVLVGALFLILADLLARTVVSPAELPVGIITAMLGGPFFLYLLVRHRAWQL